MKSVQTLIGEVVADTNAAIMPTVMYNLQAVNNTIPLADEINYQYGHEKEISARIAMWSSNTKKYQNFPLIWLREDITFRNGNGFRVVVIPSIVIAWNTRPNYDSLQREAFSFVPVLRPIYQAFKQALSYKREFRIYDPYNDMPHTAIERKFWGTPDDEQAKNVFKGYVDAIEIVNLELTLDEDCDTYI